MRLAEIFERVAGPDTPVEFRAYDGSRAGQIGSDIVVEVRTPVAVAYLAQAPGALGLARAYVSGHIEVTGDLYTALARMSQMTLGDISWSDRLKIIKELGGTKMLVRVPPPPQEKRINRLPFQGLRHSKGRDAEVISHHYDVSNAFYEYALGPSMTYTCACYPTEDATLEQAQYHKHDLVARKLDLKPGMRLLDVGCGWGGMVMHAAEHYGVKGLGVTLSKQQAEWAQKAIAERGLGGLAEVRHLDYRDVPETAFDAVSSIGLTEHIGKANVASYFGALYAKLRPGGRLLNHCITRPDDKERANYRGGFINRYIFPDGELEGPGWLSGAMNGAGFEIRHEENLREHYAKTLRHWCENLERNWDAARAEVDRGTARVWRLYLAACVLGFEQNVVQLHQILGVKLDGTTSHMPLRPAYEPPAPYPES